MMKKLLATMFLITGTGMADDAFDRIAKLAPTTEKWNQAKSLEGRIWAIRAVAESYDISSNPVSDRYLITRYGGPIDFVHFFALAAQACRGDDLNEILFHQWKSEGGPDFEAGRTRTYPVEAHPDDLPSNAFGALIGQELRPHNKDLSFPIIETLREFFVSLSPFPDEFIKKYSHAQVVMGFQGNPTMGERYRMSEWFSALPLFLVPRLEPMREPKFRSSRAALQYAGYDVYRIKGKPIGIKRTGD
ncbi:MAG: hypothetical protein AAF191_01520 [Verrucomicrobiota bacterium]